ncbi:female-specific protein transformer isoform X2 [Solenopsis invicta]|uniref:female-specific protein transformer isoform X2 n=1 Tax=Solenopsis invicta TaxID=13686 RepID=UPI00193D593A|nr:female-specific protein transformer isoform X2 [Solenopsis invicta]
MRTIGAIFENIKKTQINTELRQIKVTVHRDISVKGHVTEIQRGILNPEDIIVTRRNGEGCKPIFDRDEIKQAVVKTVNICMEEPTKSTTDEEELALSNSETLNKQTSSVSLICRNCGYNSEYHSRHRMDIKYQDSKTKNYAFKNDERTHTEDYSKYKEKYIEKDTTKHDTIRLRSREQHDSHSRYRERSYKRSHERRESDRDRDRFRSRSRERKDEYFHESKAKDRNRDWDKDEIRDRDKNREKEKDRDEGRNRSRERRDATPHIEPPIPAPTHHNNFPPRPIVVNSMLVLREQIPPLGPLRRPIPPLGPLRRPIPPLGPLRGHIPPVLPLRGHIPPMGRGRYLTPVWPRFVQLDMCRPRHPSPN